VNQVCRPSAAVARHWLLGERFIKILRNHNGVREAVPVALDSGKQVQILPICRSCAQSHALGSRQEERFAAVETYYGADDMLE